jgi:hypothetical protein
MIKESLSEVKEWDIKEMVSKSVINNFFISLPTFLASLFLL